MIKAKVSTDYKDIERIFAGGSIQKEILKVWSTEANAYVFEAWRILEMEGPLPLTITANGEPLLDYQIYGNTVQNDTPTPETPIMPIGCGVRTENLANDSISKNYTIDDTTGQPIPATSTTLKYWCMTQPINVMSGDTIHLRVFNYSRQMLWKFTIDDGNENVLSRSSGLSNGSIIHISATGFMRIAIYVYNASETYMDDAIDSFMLTEGSTAPKSYIPYGYKLPILSNSTVTNIYLGEAETTRRIKKLVLTGEEQWYFEAHAPNRTVCRMLVNANINAIGFCSHIMWKSNYSATDYNRIIISAYSAYSSGSAMYMSIADIYLAEQTLSGFKSYLAAQYAAGTPVTVWYVLAEPETGIVNEPLMKIGNYADTIDSAQANVQIPTSKGTTTIDYDGENHFITSDGYELVDKNQNGFLLSGPTLRPSKMYIKYKGR